eukprot:12899566-Prorocentrum_lima.AAC.1
MWTLHTTHTTHTPHTTTAILAQGSSEVGLADEPGVPSRDGGPACIRSACPAERGETEPGAAGCGGAGGA